MKITVADAVASLTAIQQFGRIKLPFQPSMMVAKNGKILQEVKEEFEKRRMALGEELGEHGKNGLQVKPENVDVFQNRIKEMMSEELDLDLKTVSMADLVDGNGKAPEVEPNVLVNLQWMITMKGRRPSLSKKRGS